MARPPASERAGPEDFRGAQRRHRIAARLRAIPAVIAAAVMGIPLSVYLSPVLLALAILVGDLINFLIPMPDLGGAVMGRLDDLLDGDPGTLEAIIGVLLLWLIPGVVGLVVAYVLVRWRLGAIGGDGIAAAIGGREPRSGDLEEQQLVDVIGELAVAAGIERPRVLLYDDGPANALVYGRSPDHATVLVGRGILVELDREATQGAMARLIASAVDGDLGLATDVGAVYVTYGLLSTTLNAVVSPSARKTASRRHPGPPRGRRRRSRGRQRHRYAARPPERRRRPGRHALGLPDPAHDGRPHHGRHGPHQPLPDRAAAGLRVAVARLSRRCGGRRPHAEPHRDGVRGRDARGRPRPARQRLARVAAGRRRPLDAGRRPAPRAVPLRHRPDRVDRSAGAFSPGPARGDGRPAPGRRVGRRRRRTLPGLRLARDRAATGASRCSSSR